MCSIHVHSGSGHGSNASSFGSERGFSNSASGARKSGARITLLLAGALFVSVLAAGSVNGFNARDANAKTYIRGAAGDPETLNPQQTSTTYEAALMRDLFEGLVSYDGDAKVIPGVAERWDVSADGKTYTFHLRNDAKWSTGDPVTAEDFVFSWRNILLPETAAQYATNLFAVKNAEAVNTGEAAAETLGARALNARTLEVTLESPTPYFIQLLTHQALFPVHPPTVKKFGDAWPQQGNHVSNGPYILKENVPKARIVLAKNPYFRDVDGIAIDEVHYIPIEDRAAGIRRFAAGEIDSYSDIPTEELAQIKETYGDQVYVTPYLGTYYYALRQDKGPLKDRRVRTALSMAIDRDFLSREIWSGTNVPGYHLVPPGIGNYPVAAIPAYAKMDQLDREDAALELMEQAGYGPDNPITLRLRYNTSENHKNTAIAVADMWKPLGVTVELVNADVATHYAVLREKGDYDVARAAWVADYNDPYNFLFLVRHDSPSFNYANYNNPQYDELLDLSEKETDLGRRAELMRRAEAIFNRDLPFIPMMFLTSRNIVSARVLDWHPNTQDVHPTRFLDIAE